MTRNQRDAAPNGGAGKASAGATENASVTAEGVARFLRRHPDFFAHHPDLLDVLTPLARDRGNGVLDLQQFMVERLRNELSEMAAARDALVITGRGNLSAQTRVHKAILALLAARNFEHFIETLTTDTPVILDLDVVTIGVEQTNDNASRTHTAGVCRLESGMVECLLGPRQAIALHADIAGNDAIFGAAAGLVRSEALIRLSIGKTTPVALLALGSRNAEHFQEGQGTELLSFLARVVENSIRGWLNLPA
ncbi:MAG: DUF484 family protein [Alphaproteobacteria bacterium]